MAELASTPPVSARLDTRANYAIQVLCHIYLFFRIQNNTIRISNGAKNRFAHSLSYRDPKRFWGLGLPLGYLATSGAKSDVIGLFLLGDRGFK